MSRDWSIRCLDCDEDHPFRDANHELALMVKLIAAAPQLAAMHELTSFGDVQLETRYGFLDTAFFAKHSAHRLKPVDDKGVIDGLCSKMVECVCGRPTPCALPEGHAEPCLPGSR